MKTTVVPAQVTTVEDRIAGSLTLPQIVLLVIPLLTSTAIYVLVPLAMHFSVLKIILILFQFVFFGGLAIRFRSKIIADWLVIYLRYKARPRRYIFTKNDISAREIFAPHEKNADETAEKPEEEQRIHIVDLKTTDKIKVERLLRNPLLTLSFKIARKGGIDVRLENNKR